MANNQLISVVDYLRIGSTVHKEHLHIIRNMYKQLISEMPNGIDGQVDPDDMVIKEVARGLNLRNDTDETQDYLRECVRYSDENINLAIMVIEAKIEGNVEPLDEGTLNGHSVSCSKGPIPPLLTLPSVEEPENDTILDKINCVLNVKMNIPEVQIFIQSFLLQKVNKPENIVTTIHNPTTKTTVRYNELLILPVDCLLDLFIRQQLYERDTNTSSGRQNSTHFRLIEPISMTDDFSAWHYDHWHGLFDLIIETNNNTDPFPPRWRLADNAVISYRLRNNDSAVSTSFSSVNDKPRTTSLDVFVRDICTRENNGQAKIWLKALRTDDILTFEHLANLSHAEWDRIQRLSMHAKKILKAAVDQDRVSVTSARSRQRQPNSDNPELIDEEILQTNPTKKSRYSRSEMLANLHLIKLFLWHTLRHDHRIQQYGALPRLETACLDTAFTEMQNDGFADDGLFLKIKEFFYPLTVSEHEIRRKRQSGSNEHRAYLNQRDQLDKDSKELKDKLNEHAATFWDLEYKCDSLNKQLKTGQCKYTRDRENIQSRLNTGQQHLNAQALQQHDQQWQRKQTELNRQLKNLEQLKKEAAKKKNEYEKQLEENEKNLNNINKELEHPRKDIDEQLIKPARGLIMYGPPGTGKSQIMSQLAKKLGIFMVGEPLAAGELNRPLVGESERILIALCTRCHRVPYAMCCISIDEIDSLAPKRDEDSSEGKVDKISVLLSLIEGIKDVPNLMILCATNRLHMMDEAFLRRMSGKFFVGRPTPNARLFMLKKIPQWALKLELIDRLTTATTNFSGAAVKALTRAITVRAMVAQRTDPTYQIDEKEALKITDRTAEQYQVFIGSETLARLLLRNPSEHIENLSDHTNYTGRIVIDLYNGYVRIEIHTKTPNRNTNSLAIEEQELHSNEINVQTLLERLSSYGKKRNVQLLQLIDLNLLASQGAYDEKKVFETLKDRYDECNAYLRSMIIYDLDALVGVNKSESDSNMGRSVSSSVVNANIYTYVRARFRDCAMEEKQDNIDQIERWAVAIIREPFLFRQFCTDVQFARTIDEEEELEFERHKSEDQLKCVKCKDFYIENENKLGNCVHHDGFIYDNSAADLTQHKAGEVVMLLNQLECEILLNPERREEFERQKTKFKWICCDATFTNGSAGGCKKGKHGHSVHGNDDEDLKERYATGRADRLERDVIEKWEDACRFNDEYNEKWLLLLNRRLRERE